MPVLAVSDLYKRFNLEAGFFARFGRFINAVNGVSFSIDKNEAYGLVGESGCGKTTTARLLVRMYEADSGTILYYPQGQAAPLDAGMLARAGLKQYREKVKYVFQDPARSLNPRMSVYEVLVSGCRWSSMRMGERELKAAAAAILEEAGLRAADLERRPQEFSGGQRQRISIARGLLMQPELLICDEVVSALDVSIQGQILNLLLEIREKRGISFLFIAHDLKVASYFCDRIGVMYRGELMEEAAATELYKQGQHPYTRLLFSSAAGLRQDDAGIAHNGGTARAAGNGAGAVVAHNGGGAAEADSGAELSGGVPARCAFAERCPRAEARCFAEKPELMEAGPGHLIRCFFCG